MRRRSRSWSNSSVPTFDLEGYLLAKHKGEMLLRNEIKIKCGTNFHKIRLNFPGPIELLHHDQRNERMLARLGGSDYQQPECMKFLKDWKEFSTAAAYNRPIAMEVVNAQHKVRNFKNQLTNCYCDWLEKSLFERLEHRVNQLYRHLHHKVKGKFYPKQAGYRYDGVGQPDEPPVLHPEVRLVFRDVRKGGVELEQEDNSNT